MLLLALVTAAVLRFWQLDQFPAGLYRDEAFNGLDALNVLAGDHAIFFPANNGREPLYIYLTSLSIAVLGQSILAVRSAAALVGTLATIPFYLLGKSWFDWRTGVLAAWVWSITLWPVHLSRLGLRPILVVPLMVLTFWLVTGAYRRHSRWLWGLAGAIYGIGFYTYLAFRFTPLLLLLVAVYMIVTERGHRLWPGVLWFAGGTLLVTVPLAYLVWQQPDLLLGRSGQVSILNPDVYGDSIGAAFVRHTWSTMLMFLWQGDSILRHNPSGRPVFDSLMALPFIIGLLWSLWNWRRLPAITLLLWLVIMLGPTILAADAPHFLRSVGALPAAMLLTSVGLARLWQWPRLPQYAGAILACSLIVGSLIWTITDYKDYAHDPEVALAFEAAATELAGALNAEDEQTVIYIDDHLWTSWPSLAFLVPDGESLFHYWLPDDLPESVGAPATIYTWPYESLDYMPGLPESPVIISAEDGPLTRSDFEESAYPLYVKYRLDAQTDATRNERIAKFGDQVYLVSVNVDQLDQHTLQVDIYWGADGPVSDDLVAFIHVIGPEGLAEQDDWVIANGRWPGGWWRLDLLIRDSRTIKLDEPFDADQQWLELGLYQASTNQRLTLQDTASGRDIGTEWRVDLE